MSTVHQEDFTSPMQNTFVTKSGGTAGKSQLINLTEARKILGVSPNKMSKLVSDGTLRYESDPLDQRVKRVRREDVEKLKEISGK